MTSTETDDVAVVIRRAITSTSLDSKSGDILASSVNDKSSIAMTASSLSVDGSKTTKLVSPSFSIDGNKMTSLTFDGKLMTPVSSKNVTVQDVASTTVETKVIVQDAKQFNVWRERRRKCKKVCLQIIAFLCSTIGMCCLLIAYVLLGGVIFMAIEGSREKSVKVCSHKHTHTLTLTLTFKHTHAYMYYLFHNPLLHISSNHSPIPFTFKRVSTCLLVFIYTEGICNPGNALALMENFPCLFFSLLLPALLSLTSSLH